MLISYLEIYNERIYDLLQSKDNQDNLKLFENKMTKEIIVQDLNQVLTKSVNDGLKLLSHGE